MHPPKLVGQICKALTEKITTTPINDKLGKLLAAVLNIAIKSQTRPIPRRCGRIDNNLHYYATHKTNPLKTNVINLCVRMIIIEILSLMTMGDHPIVLIRVGTLG